MRDCKFRKDKMKYCEAGKDKYKDCEAGKDKVMKIHLDPSKDIRGQWRSLGSPILPRVENYLRKNMRIT